MKKILKAAQNIFITKAPTYVFFFVTSFCNARCKMCFNWRNTDRADLAKELKLEEIKKAFNSFSNIQQLTISGGEPFLRDDLPEILGFISRKNDVQMITLPTNGILSDKIFRQTADILKRLKKSTHLRLGLSVEGIGEKHDEIVQVKGAFECIKNTYQKVLPLTKACKNFNLDIGLCCSAFNKDDLKDTIKYCNEYFKGCTIELVLARGDTRDKLSKNVTNKEYQEILDYFDRLKEAKKINKPFARVFNALAKIANNQTAQIISTKKMPSRCYAYSKLIVIMSNGDILPCEYLGKKLGNLKDYGYDITKILNKKNNKEIEKSIRNGECFCTWECALINNLVCNPRMYPMVLKELIKGKC